MRLCSDTGGLTRAASVPLVNEDVGFRGLLIPVQNSAKEPNPLI